MAAVSTAREGFRALTLYKEWAPGPGMAILHRELLTNVRSTKPFVFTTVLVLLLLLLLIYEIENSLGTDRIATDTVDTRAIRQLFTTITMMFYGGALLIVPAMAATAICSEKQLGTLDQLKTTYIRPPELIAAKLANILGIYALILVATFPVLGVAFFLVGIDWLQFALSIGLIAVFALSCSAIGIYFSARCQRPIAAIFLTLLTILATHHGLVLGLLIVAWLLPVRSLVSGILRNVPGPAMDAVHPLGALANIWSGDFGLLSGMAVFIYHGTIIAIALLLAIRILHRPTQPPATGSDRPIDDPSKLEARRKRFPYYLLDPRRRRPLIPDGKNPVYVREMQVSFASWGAWPIRAAYGFGILCFLLSIHTLWTTLDKPAFWRSPYTPIMIGTLCSLLFIPALVALPMAREHESGDLDMLRATLLRSWEVSGGMFRAALAGAVPMGAGIVLGSFPLLFLGNHHAAGDVVAMALTVLYTMALVQIATARIRNTTTVLLTAYGTTFFAHFALPYLSLYVIEFISPRYIDLNTADANAASVLSPFWARITTRQAAAMSQWDDGGLYWFSYATCCLLLILGLFVFANRRFHTMYHRS